jgi:hypothetical protein
MGRVPSTEDVACGDAEIPAFGRGHLGGGLALGERMICGGGAWDDDREVDPELASAARRFVWSAPV